MFCFPAVTEENRPKTAAELSQEIVLRNEPQQNYTIGGVKVQFPCKPYPSQFSIINKVNIEFIDLVFLINI